MAGPVHFAWVEPGDTSFATSAHAVDDEDIVGFELSQKEGDFASLVLEVRNPRVGLLGPGRKRWAWFSYDDPSSGGVTPLFFGRLIGIPANFSADACRLNFVARPLDFDAQKRALAETLKVSPYWDPVWFTVEERDKPDTVLEARPLAWHCDPVTHLVTVSDQVTGEDGTLSLGMDDFVGDSLETSLGQPPLRMVRIEAEVHWTQGGKGALDLKQELLEAFQAAGTNKPNLISSYTGDGLASDWPNEANNIGGGWEFGPSSVEQVDGKLFEPIYMSVYAEEEEVLPSWGTVVGSGGGYYLTLPGTADPAEIKIQLYHFRPELAVRYEASRERSEKLTFNLEADVQALLTEPGEDEVLVIPLSSVAVSEVVDPVNSDANGIPIGDVRRRDYFNLDRGRQSVEFLIALARAALLRRARAVEISIQIPFTAALGLSLRKSALIIDDRLPGGQAAGKIVGWRLAWGGGEGAFVGEFTIGCMIGQGNTVTITPGTPDYVEEGVLEPGIQHYTGQTIMPIAGEVTYGDYYEPPNDDGLDLFNLTVADAVDSFEVLNGPTAQAAAVGGNSYPDGAAALAALKAVKTEVDIGFLPVDNGPFLTEYVVPVSQLMVPKHINLESP